MTASPGDKLSLVTSFHLSMKLSTKCSEISTDMRLDFWLRLRAMLLLSTINSDLSDLCMKVL